jgi:hypothetical protein
MHRTHGTSLIAALAALVAAPALALPPPLSDAELDERSDVIATVRVLAVACTGETEMVNVRESLPVYQAWLQVVRATKGPVKPRETLLVQWHDVPKSGIVGPWKVAYFPGEEVRTHLKWDAKQRVYATTWWNAKGQPTRKADVTELPGRPGRTVQAKPAAGSDEK